MYFQRAVTAEDDAFLFGLYASTRREELAQWGWEKEQQLKFLRMQFQCQSRSYQMQYPNLETKIILTGDAKVGRIITAKNNSEMVLVDISLLPEFYNQGFGTALLKDLQQKAHTEGIPLRLSVLTNNPAKRLYERMGFKTVETNETHTIMRWIK